MRLSIANMRTSIIFFIGVMCAVATVRGEAYVFPTGSTTVDANNAMIVEDTVGEVTYRHVVYANQNLDETGIRIPEGATVSWAVGAQDVSFGASIVIDAGGELKIVGTTGQLKLVGSEIAINGTLAIEATGDGNQTGFYANGSTVTVNGTLRVANTGDSKGLRFYYSSMNVAANGVFDVDSGGRVLDSGSNTFTKQIGAEALPYFIASLAVPDLTASSPVITDATAYVNGFTVGTGITVTWRADATVVGPIVVEAGGALVLGDDNGPGQLVIGSGALLQNDGAITINTASTLVLGNDNGIGRLVVGNSATLQNDGVVTIGLSSTCVCDGETTNNATIFNRGALTINGAFTNGASARLIGTGESQLAIGEVDILVNNGVIALGLWSGLGDSGVGTGFFASNFNGYLNGIVVPYLTGEVTIGGSGTYDVGAADCANGFFAASNSLVIVNVDVTVAENGKVIFEDSAGLRWQANLILNQGAFFNDDEASRKSVVFFDAQRGSFLFIPYLQGSVEIGATDDLSPGACDHGFVVSDGSTARINDTVVVAAGVVRVLPGGALTIGNGRTMTFGRGATLDIQAGGSVVMEGAYATLCLNDCDVYGSATGTTIGAVEGNSSGTLVFENIVWLHNIGLDGGEVNTDPINALVFGSQDAPINVVCRNNAQVLVYGYVKIWPVNRGVV